MSNEPNKPAHETASAASAVTLELPAQPEIKAQAQAQAQALSVPRTIQVAPVPTKTPIHMAKTGVQLTSLEDAFRFSQAIVASGLAPKGMERPESVMVAIQLGMELGLTPMAALQNIGVINGRPGIFGDAALALVRASGLLEKYVQRWEGEGDKRRAVVISKRVNEAEMETSFSVEDAKKAGLWGKAGPWTQYSDRMLLFRARGFALRDGFGDVLKGLRTTEELGDMPAEKNITPSLGETIGAS